MGKTLEQTILNAVENSINSVIKTELIGYNKPLSQFVNTVIAKHEDDFIAVIDCGITDLFSAKGFKLAIKEALNKKLASVLINKMGGEIEKKVNELKRDAKTRAKITLAIDGVINEVLNGVNIQEQEVE